MLASPLPSPSCTTLPLFRYTPSRCTQPVVHFTATHRYFRQETTFGFRSPQVAQHSPGSSKFTKRFIKRIRSRPPAFTDSISNTLRRAGHRITLKSPSDSISVAANASSTDQRIRSVGLASSLCLLSSMGYVLSRNVKLQKHRVSWGISSPGTPRSSSHTKFLCDSRRKVTNPA